MPEDDLVDRQLNINSKKRRRRIEKGRQDIQAERNREMDDIRLFEPLLVGTSFVRDQPYDSHIADCRAVVQHFIVLWHTLFYPAPMQHLGESLFNYAVKPPRHFMPPLLRMVTVFRHTGTEATWGGRQVGIQTGTDGVG